jgi:hypothetical protein
MSDPVSDLVKRIHETLPVQSGRRQAVHEDLRRIRGGFDTKAAPAQAHYLDAALLLLEFMDRSEEMATAETLSIVASLVESVSPRHVNENSTSASCPVLSGGDVEHHADLRLSQQFLLGSLLVQSGLISPESLARGLHLHTSSGMPLGQCLVKLGAATAQQIESTLEFQDRQREEEKAQRPAQRVELKLSTQQRGFARSFHAQVLGEVMIRMGTITREQLDKALRIQRATDLHMGAALVESGAATWEQVRRALEVQKQLRRSAA